MNTSTLLCGQAAVKSRHTWQRLCVETTIWFFPCFPSRLCERQCCSVSARQCSRLCERHCCFLVSCLRFLPFCLFLGWFIHASHMLSYRISSRPLTMLLLRDSANQSSMSRRWCQRYPASITSVIHRIDTFTNPACNMIVGCNLDVLGIAGIPQGSSW